MNTDKIQSILLELTRRHDAIRGLDGQAAISEGAAACETELDGLASELGAPDTPQRFGPLLYSLRSIYDQIAQTRAMVDVPRLVEWADAVLARISRELSAPEKPVEAAAPPALPEGAREFVIFESLARPGYRVACYHMGIGDELFGLDGKPRVPPDPTKWHVVAYTLLPAGRDLISDAMMLLPGDEGLPDWNATPPPAVLKFEGHAPVVEFVPEARTKCPNPECQSLELIGTPVCAACHTKLTWEGDVPTAAGTMTLATPGAPQGDESAAG